MEYSGLDLCNKYIKAKEAINDDNIDNKVKLKFVEAIFYFKNNERLYISSNFGYTTTKHSIWYLKKMLRESTKSTLSAEKAEYLNSKNFLTITKDVKINDTRGTMIAEKLMFDIEKNTLDISSSGTKINANLNYKWKLLEYLNLKKDKPVLDIKDVSKSFDGRPVLKKLSLKVFPGM